MLSIKVFEALKAKEDATQLIANYANEARREVLIGVFASVSLFKPNAKITIQGEKTTPEEVAESAKQMGFDELVDLYMGLVKGFAALDKDYTGHYDRTIEYLQSVRDGGVEDEC